MTFETNWSFQLKYYDAIEAILKANASSFIIINVADPKLDKEQATDFVVTIEGGDVAVRIRRSDCRYRDLTIRSRSNYGGRTEINKIRDGCGKYYLYCWEGASGKLDEWILVDLDMARKNELIENRSNIPNGDGTYFIAISLMELYKTDCLIAHQGVSI